MEEGRGHSCCPHVSRSPHNGRNSLANLMVARGMCTGRSRRLLVHQASNLLEGLVGEEGSSILDAMQRWSGPPARGRRWRCHLGSR